MQISAVFRGGPRNPPPAARHRVSPSPKGFVATRLRRDQVPPSFTADSPVLAVKSFPSNLPGSRRIVHPLCPCQHVRQPPAVAGTSALWRSGGDDKSLPAALPIRRTFPLRGFVAASSKVCLDGVALAGSWTNRMSSSAGAPHAGKLNGASTAPHVQFRR